MPMGDATSPGPSPGRSRSGSNNELEVGLNSRTDRFIPTCTTGSLPFIIFISLWFLLFVVVPMCIFLPIILNSPNVSTGGGIALWVIFAVLLGAGVVICLVMFFPIAFSGSPAMYTSPFKRRMAAEVGHRALHRVVFLVDCTAGADDNGRLVREQLAPILDRHSVRSTVVTIGYEGVAREWAYTDTLENVDAIFLVGGDGMLNELVNGMMRRQDARLIPVAVIPLPQKSSTARCLGLDDPEDTVERLATGRVQMIDIQKITMGERHVYAASFSLLGLLSDMGNVAIKYRRRNCLDWFCPFWTGMGRAGQKQKFKVELTVGNTGQPTDIKKLDLAVNSLAVQCGQFIGPNYRLAPDAVLDDGLLDVVIVRPRSRGRLCQLWLQLPQGRQLKSGGTENYQVRELKVFPHHMRPRLMNVDGLPLLYNGPIHIVCIPSAFPLLVPGGNHLPPVLQPGESLPPPDPTLRSVVVDPINPPVSPRRAVPAIDIRSPHGTRIGGGESSRGRSGSVESEGGGGKSPGSTIGVSLGARSPPYQGNTAINSPLRSLFKLPDNGKPSDANGDEEYDEGEGDYSDVYSYSGYDDPHGDLRSPKLPRDFGGESSSDAAEIKLTDEHADSFRRDRLAAQQQQKQKQHQQHRRGSGGVARRTRDARSPRSPVAREDSQGSDSSLYHTPHERSGVFHPASQLASKRVSGRRPPRHPSSGSNHNHTNNNGSSNNAVRLATSHARAARLNATNTIAGAGAGAGAAAATATTVASATGTLVTGRSVATDDSGSSASASSGPAIVPVVRADGNAERWDSDAGGAGRSARDVPLRALAPPLRSPRRARDSMAFTSDTSSLADT